jgi:GNAT superfamily N-acetyltransferase
VTVVVRAAVADDAAAVTDLRYAAWRAAYGPLLPAEFFATLDREAAIGRWRRGVVAGREACVAERDGELIGFCAYGRCRDDDLPDAREVYSIYVHPDRWSTGAGRALMSAALDTIRSGPVALWVLRDNARARRFYEIGGWRPDGATRDVTIGGIPLPEVRYRLD